MTPRLATNQNKQITWRWEGEAFGETEAQEDPDGDGNTTTINLRFPGQYYDKETGLHYNWFRDYNPQTGRYRQSDPIGLDGGLNTYGYAYQNPLMYYDPDGRVPLVLIIPLIGGGINALAGGISEALECDSDFPSILRAAGQGFAGGFIGTGVGLGVSALTGNVALAGAAGSLTGNLIEQGLASASSGQNIDLTSAATSTLLGAVGGVAANKAAPTVGRSPSLSTSRNPNNFGPNSQRLAGQAGISGAIGAAGGIILNK